MYKLSLAHIYPKLLNISGDAGNVLALSKRCEWYGIELQITDIGVEESINPAYFDMYFLGGGQDAQRVIAAKKLQSQKNALQDAAEQKAVFLAICGGYQLLGKYYQPKEADRLSGLGLLDTYTIEGEKRFTGNVTAKSDFLNPSTIVGFENHSGKTYLEEGTLPIATVEIGCGNNGQDKTEGACKRNVFGTYLHGSFLPKNPHFADYLIGLALEKKYNEKIELAQLDNKIEYLVHNSLIGKKY